MNSDQSQTLLPVKQSLAVETSASASAALAKATIEAKFVIALRPENRRDIDTVRETLVGACKRDRFAKAARFKKRQGDKKNANGVWEPNFVEGFTIRFAETALQAWKNVDISSVMAWQDEKQRLVRTTVTDLESNISYTIDTMAEKQVERSKVREGQTILGERKNSEGKKVFIVQASEDELSAKINSAISKAIRNGGLRLIPKDILEEAEDAVIETIAASAKSEDALKAAEKVVAAFASEGVTSSQLEAYLKHPLSKITSAEIVDLRKVYAAVHEGAPWSDYEPKQDPAPTTITVPADDTPTDTPAPQTPVPETKPEPPKPPATPSTQKRDPSVYAKTIRTSMRQAGITEAKLITVIHGFFQEAAGCKTIDEVDAQFPATMRKIVENWVELSAAAKEVK